jgi:hypothetical protein
MKRPSALPMLRASQPAPCLDPAPPCLFDRPPGRRRGGRGSAKGRRADAVGWVLRQGAGLRGKGGHMPMNLPRTATPSATLPPPHQVSPRWAPTPLRRSACCATSRRAWRRGGGRRSLAPSCCRGWGTAPMSACRRRCGGGGCCSAATCKGALRGARPAGSTARQLLVASPALPAPHTPPPPTTPPPAVRVRRHDGQQPRRRRDPGLHAARQHGVLPVALPVRERAGRPWASGRAVTRLQGRRTRLPSPENLH